MPIPQLPRRRLEGKHDAVREAFGHARSDLHMVSARRAAALHARLIICIQVIHRGEITNEAGRQP
jgi:hypothetical protein